MLVIPISISQRLFLALFLPQKSPKPFLERLTLIFSQPYLYQIRLLKTDYLWGGGLPFACPDM